MLITYNSVKKKKIAGWTYFSSHGHLKIVLCKTWQGGCCGGRAKARHNITTFFFAFLL